MSDAVSSVDSDECKQELIALIPQLRAFARSMCGTAVGADDLAQEAMLKAWKARERFDPGTNLRAWVFTILRNHFYSEQRRAFRSQPLEQEVAENTLMATDDPTAPLELLALWNALKKLPDEQREAIILVGAGGLSYEEAAEICDCALGTIKSRVSRGRRTLEDMLNDGSAGFSKEVGIDAGDALANIMAEADALQQSPQ